MSDQTGGRPAALFQINRNALRDRAATGLVIPRLRQSPNFSALAHEDSQSRVDNEG